jgi:DNA-binding MarR family transcriptional regulator
MENKHAELYEKLSRLQWLLGRRHMRNFSERGPFADPTRGQGRALAMLKMQSEISAKDLSYLLGIRQQSLNELLNKLEKSGYVKRAPSETDRRVMMVTLTEKGKAARQEDTDYSDMFDCLDPDEQAAFGDYLDRVIAALETRLGTESDEEDMANWMRAARSRMGAAMFEHMMSMRGGFGRHGRGPGDESFFGGFGLCARGRAHDGMSGEEGFDPGYDGAMPDTRDFGRSPRDSQTPSPDPKSPYESGDE